MRLVHPRLSFRDDTPRVVERMQEVTVGGSAIWDRQSVLLYSLQSANVLLGGASPAPSSVGSAVDDLAPFATLLTDEDRERKAEASPPGTFNVIVNPDSFNHLAEYIADGAESKRSEAMEPRRASIATSLASSLGRDSVMEGIALAGDPNIVILPRFEDSGRRSMRDLRAFNLDAATTRPTIKQEDSDEGWSSRSPDLTTLRHFRDHVWKQLIPPEHEPDSSIELLDEAAAKFPPVRNMKKPRTLPELQASLRSEEDLASDGAFLTHFLMLIYEVATGDLEHPDIWARHISTLLRIALLRRQIFGGERFPYVCWWICNIDLEALLSGTGSGRFVGYMLKNDLIPPPSFHLYPLGDDGSSVVYSEETQALPIVLQLDYQVTLHAIQLGLLANEFRNDASLETADVRQKAMAIKVRQSRISEIQEGLRQLWTVPAVQSLAQMQFPLRAQRLFHHAWTMYRACMIYSHTSMWPCQRTDTSPDFDPEITAAAQQILQVSQAIVSTQAKSSRFLVFPLFMAGWASTSGNQKLLVQDLIQKLEEESLGCNTRTTRRALQAVYERQNQHFMRTGQSLDVCWLDVMREQGLTVVNFGL
ncbi:hypothetical protein LTS08_006894 [Lithohypha guttulata]|nr:hypothetical protein LTR51_001946 [Lithohypha guttulata]KAK5097481.1 hypothetical protein LTS08_006894 [Lithohypha guttulata]